MSAHVHRWGRKVAGTVLACLECGELWPGEPGWPPAPLGLVASAGAAEGPGWNRRVDAVLKELRMHEHSTQSNVREVLQFRLRWDNLITPWQTASGELVASLVRGQTVHLRIDPPTEWRFNARMIADLDGQIAVEATLIEFQLRTAAADFAEAEAETR